MNTKSHYYLICKIVWFNWLSTSNEREFAWKLRCAEIKSINSVVRLTLDCSNADELMVPNVPEPASPANAVHQNLNYHAMKYHQFELTPAH